jgi:hypothetical protein
MRAGMRKDFPPSLAFSFHFEIAHSSFSAALPIPLIHFIPLDLLEVD